MPDAAPPRRSSHLRFAGMSWPDPADPRRVQHALRYGEPTREELLVAASVMAAYAQLVAMPRQTREQRIRQLREASRDAKEGVVADETEDPMLLLGVLSLYVNWRHVTRQLTTAQKELWASAVEAWQRDLYRDDPLGLAELRPADRWWLCPTCGTSITNGLGDGPHQGCMYAHDTEGVR